jgi:hypothetical protein
MLTQEGRDWLLTQEGRDWLQTQAGRDWLQTQEGRRWLQTQAGRGWLQTQEGRKWLQTQGGQKWLQTQGGRGWLQTQEGRDWLQSQDGRDWLQTQKGREWLQIQDGQEWLRTQERRSGLQAQERRDSLQTQAEQDRLQTPHGQASQSTSTTSIRVTIGEFLRTWKAVNGYNISDEPLLPAFQLIQQFKTLPDFLMFPVFLALGYHHHPTSTIPERLLPDRDIIHAMNAFESFVNEAQERSQSASDVLKYACQNWTIHLSRAPQPWDDALHRIFQAFWNDHTVSWLEMEWCLRGLRSCLDILSEGQKLAKFELYDDSILGAEIPGQDQDGYDAEPDFFQGMQENSHVSGPQPQQRPGRFKRVRLALTRNPRPAPAPASPTSPPPVGVATTLRTHLRHLFTRPPHHAIPPVVNVPFAKAKERNAAADAPGNDPDIVPYEDQDQDTTQPDPDTQQQQQAVAVHIDAGEHGGGKSCVCC